MPQLALLRVGFPIPDLLVRGVDHTLECPVYDESGDLTAPSSGTITVYNAANEKIVDAASVSVVSSIATYSLAAADLPDSEPFSDAWRIEWALTISAEDHTFIRDAHLIRSRLYPTVTQADLEARHQSLSRLIATGNDADDFVKEAWHVVIRRLLKGGRLPYLILSPYSLHEALTFKALEMIFRDGHTAAGDGKYLELADFYREAFEAEWSSIDLDNYDYGQDGQIGAEDRATAEPVIFFGGPGVDTGSSWH